MIELLVSIAILSILVAITFSIVGGVRAKAAQSACASHLGQIAKASMLYAEANDRMIARWDGDIGWIDKLLPPREGALICPVAGPINEPPVPHPISDHGGYAQNECIPSIANIQEPSLMVMYTEAARFKSPEPNVVGFFQPLHIAGPDVYCMPGHPRWSAHYGYTPIGDYGAVRHAGGSLYAMVDGHVDWLKPTSLRLPERGYGCIEFATPPNDRWKWKGPENGPYFSDEP